MNLSTYLRLSQQSADEFAKKIGTSQAAVSRYAAGKRMPRPEQMARIATATDGAVTAADFYAEPQQARAS